MKRPKQSGFLLPARRVYNDILIPRYYDPRICDDLAALRRTHELVTIDELVAAQQLLHDHGKYVPKIYYGTGPYPYIRTSDLANWELRASPKHGIPESVYLKYHEDLDVQSQDILFVHEGTYLIGRAAMVTPFDGPILYQHHLAKFRVLNGNPLGPYFFLVALAAPIVQRQIRSKQFSADIIDSVVGRLGEVTIPIPKDVTRRRAIEAKVKDAILGRAQLREQMSFVVREIDGWLSGAAQGVNCNKMSIRALMEWKPDVAEYAGRPAFLRTRGAFLAFSRPNRSLIHDVLIPKYYDPTLIADARKYKDKCVLMSVAKLQHEGVLELAYGDEIGRLNYGTGDIPFVRTSDLGSYELLADAKHGVSTSVYEKWAASQDVQAGDILIVRDGTYLVGSSTLVFDNDLPLLYCGGIIKVRCKDHSKLSPSLCYALLNTPYVRRQMRSKQFTRDVIDTLGKRFREVVLPIPRKSSVRQTISDCVSSLCTTRVKLRSTITELIETLF